MPVPEQRERIATLALLLLPALAVSAEPEALDEDFLEYLAELEDDEDDWTWFAKDDDDDTSDEKAAAKPAAAEKVKP